MICERVIESILLSFISFLSLKGVNLCHSDTYYVNSFIKTDVDR